MKNKEMLDENQKQAGDYRESPVLTVIVVYILLVGCAGMTNCLVYPWLYTGMIPVSMYGCIWVLA